MLARPSLAITLFLIALAAYALALPLFGSTFALKFITKIMVFGIFVMSLDLLIGITGLVSFGHAMFFGIGAYALYFFSPVSAGGNGLWIFPAAALLAGVTALIVGAVAVLTRGFYFIMVTLAFGQMFYSLFHDTKIAGGSDGAYINVRPVLSLAGQTFLNFSNRNALFYFCFAALIVSYLLLLWLARSPFGRVLQGIRHNEQRMGALGFNTYAYKLASFTIAGTFAGFAGVLFAAIDGYVPPQLLEWHESGLAIMMVVLGGVGTLFGPVLGAIIYSLAQDFLKSASQINAFLSMFAGPEWGKFLGSKVAAHWPIAMGLFLIAAVLSAPRGIAGFLERLFPPKPARNAGGSVAKEAHKPAPAMSLEVEKLSRAFGGLVAVNGVSVKFAPNKVHGIIGPNGAGKTTFINLLSGALKPTEGNIRLEGEEIGAKPNYAIARRGLGRSYQRTNVILAFTARENCMLAAQARKPDLFQLRDHARTENEIAVSRALRAAGIAEERADIRASNLSHGEQRQLEIAMLIASGAKLLLLDEPLAGMGPEETGRVTSLLRELSADHTIVLIEHDMDAIFTAADTLTVLVEGKLLAHGTPQEIRANAAVREAYLGDWGQERA
ncbi:MAG: branched-chain amino acid ABC transporter ATP-binding protein/permease [Xanthobacteraceae bacterium]|nr:branched-chain amino acid ABC transporter ATP-binding protein/permease [Xanthobacteraceae bacterium]QYK45191.1 MAG: branched-chain amino acid ABC transporter ATP-binding protein/permease [Xanthobacteraceae bacterium]